MDPAAEEAQLDSPLQTDVSNPLPRIGCAGWSIPRQFAERFPTAGSHLERYSQVFNAVEINSSFYRPHKPATYERWAESAPDGFRFAVKVPRTITHFRRLKGVDGLLDDFLAECTHLGPKLGPLLVQLPPGLAFDHATAHDFFCRVRERFSGQLACEPRHLSWFGPHTNDLLADFDVARVAADPAIVPDAAEPEGNENFIYYRLHGSPRIYYSDYTESYLETIVQRLRHSAAVGSEVWCIFDNTAEGAATGNALYVLEHLSL